MATAPQATEPLNYENAVVTFFKALFEFSFKEFITPKLISMLYGIALVGIGLAVLISVVGALSNDFVDASGKLVAIIVALGVGFLAVLYIRVILELMVVIFKIAEPVTDTALTLRRIEQLSVAGALVAAPGSVENRSADAKSGTSSDPASAFIAMGRDDSVPETAEDPAPDPVCSNCGTLVGPGERFCRSCGHGLTDPTG